jgi:hypothetical protein
MLCYEFSPYDGRLIVNHSHHCGWHAVAFSGARAGNGGGRETFQGTPIGTVQEPPSLSLLSVPRCFFYDRAFSIPTSPFLLLRSHFSIPTSSFPLHYYLDERYSTSFDQQRSERQLPSPSTPRIRRNSASKAKDAITRIVRKGYENERLRTRPVRYTTKTITSKRSGQTTRSQANSSVGQLQRQD